jgi:endonuclease/exonuclease/phosphatase family metal-dependent hydrolase
MQVMTFNLRFENDRDGENAWRYRKDLAVDVISRVSPAVLGTQEGTQQQLSFLQDHLPGYRMQALGRVWDDTCQYPTIFYGKERFRMLEGGEFWLSKTPSVHRSKDWDSAFPRMLNHALMEDCETRQSFWIAVTHLDHIGTQARLEQARIISAWVRNRSGPWVLMGDFNDAPDSAVHGVLTSAESGLRDTWQVLHRREDDASMTHHDFHGVPQQCRMDWILVSGEFRVLNAEIVRNNRDGRYPSDHFPYAAELDWEKNP